MEIGQYDFASNKTFIYTNFPNASYLVSVVVDQSGFVANWDFSNGIFYYASTDCGSSSGGRFPWIGDYLNERIYFTPPVSKAWAEGLVFGDALYWVAPGSVAQNGVLVRSYQRVGDPVCNSLGFGSTISNAWGFRRKLLSDFGLQTPFHLQ